MGLSFVGVFLYAGSMSTSEIVAAQQHALVRACCCCPSFVIYVVSMVGETNRAPFDLPEAEGELVGGFHTEYSLAEVRAVLPRRVHQHGHRLGAGDDAVPRRLARARGRSRSGTGANTGWWPVLWFLGKVLLFLFFFIWLRGTLPRLRYDQFMKLGWKVLIPVALGLDPRSSPPSARSTTSTTSTRRSAALRWRSPCVLIARRPFVSDHLGARRRREERGRRRAATPSATRSRRRAPGAAAAGSGRPPSR